MEEQSALSAIWYQDDEHTFLESLWPNTIKIVGGIAAGVTFGTPIKQFLIKQLSTREGAIKMADKALVDARKLSAAVREKQIVDSKRAAVSQRKLEL